MRVELLNEKARVPERASAHAAGFDLYATGNHVAMPGAHVVIPLGIAIEMPPGYYGRIAPRSGLAVRYGINIHAGVIDPDYRGELSVVAINHGSSTWHIHEGDRIAQLILEWHYRGEVEVGKVSQSVRGAGGFGSTGV